MKLQKIYKIALSSLLGMTYLSSTINGENPKISIQKKSDELTSAYNYYNGVDVPKDDKKAFEFALKASKKGIPQAFHFLGELYLKGHGVEQNLH